MKPFRTLDRVAIEKRGRRRDEYWQDFELSASAGGIGLAAHLALVKDIDGWKARLDAGLCPNGHGALETIFHGKAGAKCSRCDFYFLRTT